MTTSPGNMEKPTASVDSPLLGIFGESHNNTRTSSLYNSALEDLTDLSSFNESANNKSTSSESSSNNKQQNNTSTDLDITISDISEFNSTISPSDDAANTNKISSMLFIEKEIDCNNSIVRTEEVQSRSQLANRTIFKTDNQNLSIIEISDNSSPEKNHLESSVLVVESSSDGEDCVIQNTKQQNDIKQEELVSKSTGNDGDGGSGDEKPPMKAETITHYKNKQNLNTIDVNEEVLPECSNSSSAGRDMSSKANFQNGNIIKAVDQPVTKREIKLYNTLEEFEKNLPSTVTILDTPFGSKVYLVGTAHFSEESQDDVSYVIRNVRPDVVMVELCPSRIHILKLDEKTLLEEAKNFNLAKIRSIIQTNGYINGIFFILLLQMSAQIAKDLGMAPGGEFRRAFEEIHKLPGCMLHLGDRPLHVTLQRALRALSLWQTVKLVWRLTSTDTISIQAVEECKQRDLLEKLMQEMAGEFPAFSDVFVKERDLFLCHSLQLAALPQARSAGSTVSHPVRVVGVVGIGHANGIAKNWGRVDPLKIPEIMEIPPASVTTRICQYAIKYGLIGLTLYGAFRIVRPRLSRFF